jgi:hypothetical protein
MEYWNPDGSKEIFYRAGKVKYVASDGNVTWYKDRKEYYANRPTLSY